MSIEISLILKRVREILLPLIVIGVVPLLAGKFLLPKITQISEFRRQLKENETQVLGLEKKAAFLENQKEEGLFDSFEKVIQILPNEKDVASLLVSLESLRKGSGLNFGDFGLKPGLLATAEAELESQQLKEIEFRIPISSSYDNLLKFLERVENTAPLTSVEGVGIDFKSGKEDVSTNLLLRTYYLPLQEEQIALEEPLPEFSSSAKEILEKILGFEVFTYEISLPEEKVGKENPFSPY